ncbi:hypothetical protein GQX73_g1540 [Xylaria multiplex]|uniref:Fungal N-terminal domain-containing protein n=1 Tax=Xylaria multiplex TaxID=323545 RepID=A0A7C8MRT3_9PEZI|nr:hypothetical protein GQX73_g1540 [Xylaria multiplex]
MLCERLDYSNETITSDIFKEFEELEVEMNKFCVEAQKFDSPEKYCKPPNEDEMYKEHMKAMFRFNVVNKGLMILECTIDFELSALGFAKSVMGRYTKLCAASNPPNNLPRMSDENLQVFDNKVESLQTAARLRQTMRASVQQRAEFMVSLVSRLLRFVEAIPNATRYTT